MVRHFLCIFISCFFFQAEDGIRDRNVTGVQTCALPIFPEGASRLGVSAALTVPPRAVRLSRSPRTRESNTRRFSVRLPTAPPLPDTSYHEPPAARREAGGHSVIPRFVESHLVIPE